MTSLNMGNNHLDAPLVRQGSSVFALTFDEFQHTLGDPGTDFGSMNMDEFLRNIWTAEESQAMAAAMNPSDGSNGGLATQVSLSRQGSLSLPRTLSTKTVEEVWRSLQPQPEASATVGAGASVGAGEARQQREITLGEVTLEDFLVKAGIVKEGFPSNPSPVSFQGNVGFPEQGNDARYKSSCNGNTFPILTPPSKGGPPIEVMQQDGPQGVLLPLQQGNWMVNPYKKAFCQQHQHATGKILQVPAMVEAAPSYSNTSFVTNGVCAEASPVAGVLGKGGLDMSFGGGMSFNELGCGAASPLSTGPDESGVDTSSQYGILGRKRCADGPIEKVIQRRQRRMIKNRESAARSRARKQAYTVELEAEVSQLKEENMRLLRKQANEAHLRKKQILAVMPSASVLKDGCALKRTNTGPW